MKFSYSPSHFVLWPPFGIWRNFDIFCHAKTQYSRAPGSKNFICQAPKLYPIPKTFWGLPKSQTGNAKKKTKKIRIFDRYFTTKIWFFFVFYRIFWKMFKNEPWPVWLFGNAPNELGIKFGHLTNEILSPHRPTIAHLHGKIYQIFAKSQMGATQKKVRRGVWEFHLASV